MSSFKKSRGVVVQGPYNKKKELKILEKKFLNKNDNIKIFIFS
jgi:hypothetical protein